MASGIRARKHVGGNLEGKGGSYRENFGKWNIKEGIVFVWADRAMNELNVQRGLMEKQDQEMEEKLVGLEAELVVAKEDFKQTL